MRVPWQRHDLLDSFGASVRPCAMAHDDSSASNERCHCELREMMKSSHASMCRRAMPMRRIGCCDLAESDLESRSQQRSPSPRRVSLSVRDRANLAGPEVLIDAHLTAVTGHARVETRRRPCHRQQQPVHCNSQSSRLVAKELQSFLASTSLFNLPRDDEGQKVGLLATKAGRRSGLAHLMILSIAHVSCEDQRLNAQTRGQHAHYCITRLVYIQYNIDDSTLLGEATVLELLARPRYFAGTSFDLQMAGKSSRSRLQKLFHRHPDSEPDDTASPPHSPSSSGQQRRSRSRSASLRDTIVNKATAVRGSSKARSGRTSTDQSSANGANVSAIKGSEDAPPLPNAPPQSDLSRDLSKLNIRQTQDATARQNGDHHQVRNGDDKSSLIRQVSPQDEHQLSRKPDVNDLRKVSGPRAPIGTAVPYGSRTDIAPDEYDPDLIAKFNRQEEETKVESALGVKRGYLVKDSPTPVDLTGVVDLGKSEDTTVHERWAPAVTHETIVENVHEIREQVITREIHTHHYYHRILPVIDIEVLPARHFVPMEGGYAEIAEEEVPGRGGKNAQWMIAEMVSKMLPSAQTSGLPRQFTARQFHGTEGDYKEYVTAEGTKRTETTWVYPPELETGGQLSGQTYPFFFDAPHSTQQGIQAKLPGGQVIGMSPLLAQQRRQQAESSRVL
nr:hypothetical protein CFP56_26007 [Quercus suber]